MSEAPPQQDDRSALGVVARSLLVFVRLYQAVRAGRPSPCRYWPSCSTYAEEAVQRFGAARGLWLTVRRLGRCHPWGGSGIDAAPERAVSGLPEPAGQPG